MSTFASWLLLCQFGIAVPAADAPISNELKLLGKQIYLRADRDHSGRISLPEVPHAKKVLADTLKSHWGNQPVAAQPIIAELIQKIDQAELDTDQSKVIDPEEFNRFLAELERSRLIALANLPPQAIPAQPVAPPVNVIAAPQIIPRRVDQSDRDQNRMEDARREAEEKRRDAQRDREMADRRREAYARQQAATERAREQAREAARQQAMEQARREADRQRQAQREQPVVGNKFNPGPRVLGPSFRNK